MQWVQTKHIEGVYRKFARFKCNRCGITAEVSLGDGEGAGSLPQEWKLGPHEAWHFCPGCEKPKRAALPIV
jgi:hypothetical protein